MTAPQPGPPAARVRGNDWRALAPPTLGAWTPTRAVSVVIPHYRGEAVLGRTLAGVAEQSYPDHLLQVIVVDDGSPRPPEVSAALGGLDVVVLRQERRGFGAGRARNLGAAAAEGEIVVFLDQDHVPEPCLVEAHARWHHIAADLVTLGFRRHLDDWEGIDPAAVRAAARSGGLEALFGDRQWQEVSYVEGHLLRTAELTSGHDDLFRVVTSGNLGLRTATLAAVGGFDERFDQWGGEDTELGYRLFADGAVIVPERAARCWHQGERGFEVPSKQRSLRDQRALLAHLVPNAGFRSATAGRSFERPRAVVAFGAGDTPAEEVAGVVESVLASDFHDLVVHLALPDDHPERTWLARQFGPDPRVRVTDADADPLATAPWAPVLLRVASGTRLAAHAVAAVVDRLARADDPVGVVHIAVDGGGGASAWLTRALRRGRRVAPGAPDSAARELFGETRVRGAAVGFYAAGAAAPGAAGPGAWPTAGVGTDDLAALQAAVLALPPAQRAWLVRLATWGIGLLRRTRGLSRLSARSADGVDKPRR